jgi:hypothetical protein
MQKRIRAFQAALARTRYVFARRVGPCEAWNLRQDPASPSGWLSKMQVSGSDHRIIEFRFVVTPDAVMVTGWIVTLHPSNAEKSAVEDYGPLCQSATTLTDVSERAATFTNQVWFFSRAACERAAPRQDDRFGPTCERGARVGEAKRRTTVSLLCAFPPSGGTVAIAE